MVDQRLDVQEDFEATALPVWREVLAGADWLSLRFSSVYRGIDIPRGDGSAVVVIPGFLGSDWYLADLKNWLGRIGYRSYMSAIGRNANCPNLLAERLLQTMERAQAETGGKVHLVGHSLGGVLARGTATLQPAGVASVITIASPFRGLRAHPLILWAASSVRRRILARDEGSVRPECYSGQCHCEFADAVRKSLPASLPRTAIYTKSDAIVDWRFCMSGDPRTDIEVSGSHIGAVFSSEVYRHVAERLAASSRSLKRTPGSKKKTAGKGAGLRTFG